MLALMNSMELAAQIFANANCDPSRSRQITIPDVDVKMPLAADLLPEDDILSVVVDGFGIGDPPA